MPAKFPPQHNQKQEERRTPHAHRSTVYTGRPSDQRIPQEEAIYHKLEELSIPFTRVDHDHADTMEDCLRIESVLGGKICKNLFLCNRQQTEFYLLMMPGDKPFKTKYLSAQLGCSRLSFADAGHMEEYLHTIPGSVSALELLFDAQGKVQLVIDRPLLADDTISGHPGISTSTLRMRREDLLNYVAAVGHSPIYVDLPDPRRLGRRDRSPSDTARPGRPGGRFCYQCFQKDGDLLPVRRRIETVS